MQTHRLLWRFGAAYVPLRSASMAAYMPAGSLNVESCAGKSLVLDQRAEQEYLSLRMRNHAGKFARDGIVFSAFLLY